jgi:TPR repeat protein
MYYTGTGVTLDYSEAARWVQTAAEQGYARAQIDLGRLYEQGKGVPLDYVSAYAWYKLALAGGDERGRARMKSLSHVMTQEQISTAAVRAAHFPESRSPRVGMSNSSGIDSSFAEWR